MSTFFAYMARLKLIQRWSLMHNTRPENDAEHSLQVAMLAHALACLGLVRYHRPINPEHVATLALYHDASEVLTGDMPTPVKYHSQGLREAYREVEDLAVNRLIELLPADIRPSIAPCLTEEGTFDRKIVKAADRISAYIKCLEEQRAGNHEFDAASISIRESIEAMDLPEVQDMMKEIVPTFLLSLDELQKSGETSPAHL